MASAPRQIGDKIVIGAVDGTTGLKKYELVPARNNYSYSEVSDQSEVSIGQEFVWPITFHGGLTYDIYDPRTAGIMVFGGSAPMVHEPNMIKAPIDTTTVTLTGAANPPMYHFETRVGSTSSGKPVLYVIANESAEVNVYKISLDSADYGTLLSTQTFGVTPTQPCGQPAEWNNGSDTRWYLGLGDPTNKLQRLDTVATGTSDDTWQPEDSGTGTADARHLKVVGNRLMRSTGENEISLLPRAGNPLTEASWGSEFFVGDVSAKITELGEAGGLGYIGKEDGFYEWDTVGEAKNILPEIGFAARNCQGMVYWHGGFKIPADSGLWWTRTGEPVGPDSNPFASGGSAQINIDNPLKQGRWHGLAPYGAYIYGLYEGSSGKLCWGRERDETDPRGWGPLIWHNVSTNTGMDLDDFHGCFITKTSEFGASDIRPCLWMPTVNNIRSMFLERDGAPQNKRGDIALDSTGQMQSGRLDFGFPVINKQWRVIEGWAEDMKSGHSWQFSVYRDGNTSAENVGATVTSDGFFQRFWTQDSNDVARVVNLQIVWVASDNKTSQDGPHLRDVRIRAVALPDTAQLWTFNFWVADDTVRTAKKLRSELEAFKNDLKQYELPDGDKVNGVMTSIRLLRADEINELFADMQPPPKYVLQAQVREMVSS